jgi:ketosteroid isomerase-like protein
VHPNAELVTRFYKAFARRDAGAMTACYHPEVQFSDEVFPHLQGVRAGAMWRMLCERGKDLRIDYGEIHADADSGRAHWEAWYTFSMTGRPVYNRIDATFAFRDGRIIAHRDRFAFWAWSAQALGPVGRFLGWTPLVRGRVRAQAALSLERFIADSAGG